MRISIRNNAKVSNKVVRFIKWKLYNIHEKFNHLLYAEVFINVEGNAKKTYVANLRLGVPGNDIILREKSENLSEIQKRLTAAAQRYLRKYKTTKLQNRYEISNR